MTYPVIATLTLVTRGWREGPIGEGAKGRSGLVYKPRPAHHGPALADDASPVEILRRAVACTGSQPHAPDMFTVSAAEAAVIRTAFEDEGELSAALELRRLFPGITDNAKARACARAIAGWVPPATRSGTVTRLRPRHA